jgi:hypothetical protein
MDEAAWLTKSAKILSDVRIVAQSASQSHLCGDRRRGASTHDAVGSPIAPGRSTGKFQSSLGKGNRGRGSKMSHLPDPTGYATSVRKERESPEKLAKATEMCLPERKRVRKGGEEDDRSCRPHPGGPDELAEHAIVVWRSGCGGPCTPAIRGPRSHPGAGAIGARSDGQV